MRRDERKDKIPLLFKKFGCTLSLSVIKNNSIYSNIHIEHIPIERLIILFTIRIFFRHGSLNTIDCPFWSKSISLMIN